VAAAFCAGFDPLTKKFPFNKDAQPEVTLAELADILKPKTGPPLAVLRGRLEAVSHVSETAIVFLGQAPPGTAEIRASARSSSRW